MFRVGFLGGVVEYVRGFMLVSGFMEMFRYWEGFYWVEGGR